ncbi:hypothetical protein PM082_008962 [Marasmius tenuissimus]|nr:hypothetical protein PM082_008962 [Marasmius tenuissimus]
MKERTTLIRVGLSLRTILDPADCEGLQLQLDLQPHYRRGTKRVAEQLASPVKRLRIEPVDMGIDSSSIPNLPPASAVLPRAQLPSLPCPSLSVSPSASNLFAPSSTSTLLPLSKSDIPLPPVRGPSSSRTRDVAHSTANVSKTEKRFPLDYSVAFFGIGIRKIMDEKADDPKATEVNLYPKHFGIGYRKSSAVTYKKKWNEASEALQDEFIALGDAGAWAEFRRRIDLELQTQPNITPCRTTTTVPIQPTIPDRPTPSSGTHPNAQSQAQQSISPLPTLVVSCQSSLLLVQDAATARTRNIARSPIGSISPLLSPCELVEVSNPGRCGNRESLSDYSSAFNDTASFFASDILQEEAAGRDLCPFCDEKILPPSKILSDMLSKLLLVTEPDPLPWNADHRKAASFTVTIAFCSRHRYESELAQHPQSLLWPRNIDSLTVFQRVLAIRQVILKLIHKPEGSPFFKQTYLYIHEHGRISPVKRMNGGKPLCNGTGYYGQIGFSVGRLVTRYMFPLSVLYTETFSPLTYDDFMDEVLVPEIFTRLIQNDFSLSRQGAIELLQQSEFFGTQEHQLCDDDVSYQQVLSLVGAGALSQGTTVDYNDWLPLNNNDKTLLEWLAGREDLSIVKKEDDDGEGEMDPDFVVSPSKRRGTGNTYKDPMYVDYDSGVDSNDATTIVKREDLGESELWVPSSPTPQYSGMGSIEAPIMLCD